MRYIKLKITRLSKERKLQNYCSIFKLNQISKKGKDQLLKYRNDLNQLKDHFEFIKKQCFLTKVIKEAHVVPPKEEIVQKKQKKKEERPKVLLEVDSRVLIMKATVAQDIEFLQKMLNNPKQIQLVFRASDNQFKSVAFHQKCNNIENALVMIRTEFGKTIGGFTQYKCKHENYEVISVHTTGVKSFLLQFDQRQRMTPFGNNGLISCNKNQGPVFGVAGADILIGDNCNAQPTSMSAFPRHYNRNTEEYPQNQQSLNTFIGNSKGNRFKVQQYEVYRVVYE